MVAEFKEEKNGNKEEECLGGEKVERK